MLLFKHDPNFKITQWRTKFSCHHSMIKYVIPKDLRSSLDMGHHWWWNNPSTLAMVLSVNGFVMCFFIRNKSCLKLWVIWWYWWHVGYNSHWLACVIDIYEEFWFNLCMGFQEKDWLVKREKCAPVKMGTNNIQLVAWKGYIFMRHIMTFTCHHTTILDIIP